MTNEMILLRQMLDESGIEWHDASDDSEWYPIDRTHFENNGSWWSVIHGYGTYGGYSQYWNDEELLEVMNENVNGGEPLGWQTAADIMKLVKGGS